MSNFAKVLLTQSTDRDPNDRTHNNPLQQSNVHHRHKGNEFETRKASIFIGQPSVSLPNFISLLCVEIKTQKKQARREQYTVHHNYFQNQLNFTTQCTTDYYHSWRESDFHHYLLYNTSILFERVGNKRKLDHLWFKKNHLYHHCNHFSRSSSSLKVCQQLCTNEH